MKYLLLGYRWQGREMIAIVMFDYLHRRGPQAVW